MEVLNYVTAWAWGLSCGVLVTWMVMTRHEGTKKAAKVEEEYEPADWWKRGGRPDEYEEDR